MSDLLIPAIVTIIGVGAFIVCVLAYSYHELFARPTQQFWTEWTEWRAEEQQQLLHPEEQTPVLQEALRTQVITPPGVRDYAEYTRLRQRNDAQSTKKPAQKG